MALSNSHLKSVSVFCTKKYAFIVGITWTIIYLYTVWAITEFPVVTTSGVCLCDSETYLNLFISFLLRKELVQGGSEATVI